MREKDTAAGLRFIAHPTITIDEMAAPAIHRSSTARSVAELGFRVELVRFRRLEKLWLESDRSPVGWISRLLFEIALPWALIASCVRTGLVPYIRHYYVFSWTYFLLSILRRRFVLEVNATLREEAKFMSKQPGFLLSLSRLLEEAALRRASVVIAVSEALKSRLVGYGLDRERVFAVHNGCDCPPGEGPVPDDETSGILFVGNFKPWQRVDLLVDALTHMAEGTSVRLVGRGDTASIMRRAADLNVADALEFLGPVKHETARDLMKRSRVLVLPGANNYASPMKLFEYLASGRPTVLPDLPVLREVVTDGDHALLFRPGDAAGLASRLQLLLSDSELRQKLGRSGRALVCSEYTWARNAERTIAAVRSRIELEPRSDQGGV